MEAALNQAKHNEKFHDCICSNFPNDYYDWKITISFYIAVHYLKAIAVYRKQILPKSHYDIEKEVNPRKGNLLKLTYNAWDWYFDLYLYSRTARYDGFAIDHDTYMEIKKGDYENCEKLLKKFRNYTKGLGISI